jgi:hypothetical protein
LHVADQQHGRSPEHRGTGIHVPFEISLIVGVDATPPRLFNASSRVDGCLVITSGSSALVPDLAGVVAGRPEAKLPPKVSDTVVSS